MMVTFFRLHRRRSLLRLFLRSVLEVKTPRCIAFLPSLFNFFAKEREIFWRRLNKRIRYLKEKVEEKTILRKLIIFLFNRYTNQ